MTELDPKSTPELLNGSLQRKMLSRKFVLQGDCPACQQGLRLTDSEIDQPDDVCPSCGARFRIPPALASQRRKTLKAETDAAEDRRLKADAWRKSQQDAAAARAEAGLQGLLSKATDWREEAQRYAAGERIREAREAEQARQQNEWEQQVAQMKVTTGDLNEPYEIIGPVYFSVSNKGLFFNQLKDLIGKYRQKLADMKSRGTIRGIAMDWGFLYGEFSVGQSQFDSAFFVAVEELKQRAGRVGGNAIVHMRQDIDIDTNGMQYFYLQMYGTAVKVKQPPAAKTEEA